MILIDYPQQAFRMKKEGEKEFIFDEWRKSWLRLTPEEWVRQNFLQYLVQVKRYPATLIAIEKELWLGELKKRFDILVYNSQHQPWLMVECKAMEVVLDETALQQVLRYNIVVPVPHLVITNGQYCTGFTKKNHELSLMQELPAFE